MDEALTLHRTHDFLPGFPLAPTVLGAKALLAYRRGAVEATLELARASLEAAHADPLSRMCYPCVYAVSRLIPVAREAVCENHTRVINTPELVAKAVALGRAGMQLWGPCCSGDPRLPPHARAPAASHHPRPLKRPFPAPARSLRGHQGLQGDV